MTSINPSKRSVPLAMLLAMSLSVVAGVPALTTGPLGNRPVVAETDAGTFVRVSSLKKATKATNLSISRLGISMSIREGVLGGSISTRYAYHYPTTSWPGGHSNTYLYAHAQRGAFLNLKYARKGDILTLRLSTGYYVKYKVIGIASVPWNQGKWVMPTSYDRITLQTCLGNTATSPRLIVTAVPAY
jgi:LPXTG-site transpeptidase (sortase) family protein